MPGRRQIGRLQLTMALSAQVDLWRQPDQAGGHWLRPCLLRAGGPRGGWPIIQGGPCLQMQQGPHRHIENLHHMDLWAE